MRFMVRHIVLMLCMAFILTSALPMVAQEPETTPVVTQTSILTLEEMGATQEFTLRNVFDVAVYTFGLPADWELNQGAQVELHVSTFTDDPLATQGSTMLSVTFNTLLITALPITNAGDQTFIVDIPPEVLAQPLRDGRHELRISVDEEQCQVNAQTIIVIRNDSTIALPYQIGQLPADLRLLPRPVFQQSFLEDEAVVVIPDEPTAEEMRAALMVVGGFAKMTRGRLALQLLTISEVTPEIQANQHLIMTGRLDTMSLLEAVTLPEAVDTFRREELNDDGILAIAASPFNPSRVVLAVTGRTDAGVVKAAQTLSSGRVRTSDSSDFARIASVQPDRNFNAFQPLDSTLNEMGYTNQVFNNAGVNSTEFTFYIEPGQQLADDAYFDLTFSHSASLNYDLSSLDVIFNDEPVSGIRFSDETADPHTTRIVLPASAARSGINILSVSTILRGNTVCVDPRSQSLWLSIMDTSTLHLPQIPATAITTPVYFLSRYPNPLAANPSLSQVAFVLPQAAPETWKTAASLAYDLGRRSRGVMIDLTVVFGDDVPEEIRQNYNLVLIGLPGSLPLLSELSEVMPAPFASDTEFAIEDNLLFVYRLPADASVGYLELFQSPWNPNFVVLAVLGSTQEALQWAADALLVSNIRSTLAGNFAIVESKYTYAFNTIERTSQVAAATTEEPAVDIDEFRVQVAEGDEPAATAAATVTAEVPAYERPAWLLPAVGGITVTIVVILLSVFAYSGLQKARPKQGVNRK